VPKFVKEYAQMGNAIETAVKAYAADVRARVFPSDEYTYPMFDEAAPVTKKSKMTGS
jgi:3-methyl-2-oxobutanoate hydroxymethyltransferase